MPEVDDYIVGLIRKLPHYPVASFKATLEEASRAERVIGWDEITHDLFLERRVGRIRCGNIDVAPKNLREIQMACRRPTSFKLWRSGRG